MISVVSQAIIWVIVGVAFILGIILFIPSIMSLGAPRFKTKNRKEQLLARVSKLTLLLTLFLPFIIIVAVLFQMIFEVELLYWLLGYIVINFFLFLGWWRIEKTR